ncbi:MAG: CvpA family protein [Vulcanimicrobiaceae bacterium]
MIHPGWPDVVIAIIALFATVRGYRRGFVGELAGAVALVAALITPWWYNGAADGMLERYLHVGPGSSHVLGMFLTGIITYVLVLLLAWVLDRFARLPILGLGNALGGAAIGFAKAAVFLWFVLYVALFFPLSPDIRTALGRSQLVGYLTAPNARIDHALYSTVPWFARPFVWPYFRRHHP